MKKFILLIVTFAMCFSLCSCTALLNKAKEMATGTEASQPPEDYIGTGETEEYSYEEYKTYIKLTEYLGEKTDVEIPAVIKFKPVTTIGSLCFFEKPITSVVIPESITTIEGSAFYYADSLTSIEIPNNVTSIGTRAFGWCNALETVVLSENIAELPDFCFNHCVALKNIIIPENITKIGVRAFSYCEQLADITFSQTVNEIGERAFIGCNALEYVAIENAAAKLGSTMFEDAPNVVVIAEENSTAYNYCAQNGLRWSTSKSVDAITPELSEESIDVSPETSQQDAE